MRMKARKELDEWEERSRRQRGGTGGSQDPRLTMSVIMQCRASFSNGSSAENQKKTFEMRYKGQNKEDIETWLRNIVVLIRKKKVIDRLEGQTREICVQSVLAKWCCGCLTIFLEMEIRNVEKRDKSCGGIHIFAFEEGKSATEISTAIRLMAAAPREWGPELGVITCSMDAKQAFDNVSRENLNLVMKEMDIAPVLAGAILREHIGGKYDICFHKTRISLIPFEKSTKQGGKESPCLFNLMMRSVFRTLQEKWKMLRMGVKTRNSVGRQEEDRVSHMIFADNCYRFAESKEQILKMIGDAIEELETRGLDWKEDQMELIS